jgi:hypothetical protein
VLDAELAEPLADRVIAHPAFVGDIFDAAPPHVVLFVQPRTILVHGRDGDLRAVDVQIVISGSPYGAPARFAKTGSVAQ